MTTVTTKQFGIIKMSSYFFHNCYRGICNSHFDIGIRNGNIFILKGASKGHLISKWLFGILEFFQKTNEWIQHSTVWKKPVVYQNFGHIQPLISAAETEGRKLKLFTFGQKLVNSHFIVFSNNSYMYDHLKFHILAWLSLNPNFAPE